MRLGDGILAFATALIWGFAFVTYPFALESFSASQLAALRFIVACLPVLFVPRPAIPWIQILAIGLVLFAGQFMLLFFAYAQGMPAGLASVTQQLHVFFTVALAALLFREIPSARQWIGMGVAFAGLILIGVTVGADLKPLAFALAVSAALSWAIGNLLLKRAPLVPMFPLMVWCSLVPPVPALLVAHFYDQRLPLSDALVHASAPALATVLYLGLFGTLAGYGIWGHLLQRYPAAVVAPFALLVPVTGVIGAALLLGETFSALRAAGMALIGLGLAVIVLPKRWVEMVIPLKKAR